MARATGEVPVGATEATVVDDRMTTGAAAPAGVKVVDMEVTDAVRPDAGQDRVTDR